MIFKLHYFLHTAGANAIGILMGVFMQHYTDASSLEIGALYMLMPLSGIIFRPLICSKADREQAHRKYFMGCLIVTGVGYVPFAVIPFLGPSFHENHPRVCFYMLFFFKIIGDIAFGGVITIGDSLAINYAKRIGTEFSVYRVWGTISWMCFGVITGQINEIWFLPKYTAAFLVLLTCTFIDLALVWIWPPEYFVMVARDHKLKGDTNQSDENENQFFKSLMPRDVVWAHIKSKLHSAISCGQKVTISTKQEMNMSMPVHISAGNGHKSATLHGTFDEKPPKTVESQIESSRQVVVKSTQLKILFILLRRDCRIVLYLVFFLFAGMSVAPMGFFFMSLADICHEQKSCHFSLLGGFVQVAMAGTETVLFLFIKPIMARLGRVNCITIAFSCICVKYMFYGTIWSQVSPYYALLAESLHGIIFGIYITLSSELGHLFAHEVEFIMPELIQRQIIDPNSEVDKVKLSLVATMQALIAAANDGLGRSLGALLFGYLIGLYTYTTLWLIVGISGAVLTTIVVVINLIDHTLNLQLGLDVQARLKLRQLELGACKNPEIGLSSSTDDIKIKPSR